MIPSIKPRILNTKKHFFRPSLFIKSEHIALSIDISKAFFKGTEIIQY